MGGQPRCRNGHDWKRLMAAMASCAVLIGCVSAGPQRTSRDGLRVETAQPRSYAGMTLTHGDFVGLEEFGTTEVVRRLRPEFLLGSTRGLTGRPSEIALYVDDIYDGDLSSLNTIPLSAIRTLTFLQPGSARLRYGSACRCASGALVIETIGRRER